MGWLVFSLDFFDVSPITAQADKKGVAEGKNRSPRSHRRPKGAGGRPKGGGHTKPVEKKEKTTEPPEAAVEENGKPKRRGAQRGARVDERRPEAARGQPTDAPVPGVHGNKRAQQIFAVGAPVNASPKGRRRLRVTAKSLLHHGYL